MPRSPGTILPEGKGGMGREGDRTERPCEPGPVQPWLMGREGEGVGVLQPLRTPQPAPSSWSGVLLAPMSRPRGHVLATGPNSVRVRGWPTIQQLLDHVLAFLAGVIDRAWGALAIVARVVRL